MGLLDKLKRDLGKDQSVNHTDTRQSSFLRIGRRNRHESDDLTHTSSWMHRSQKGVNAGGSLTERGSEVLKEEDVMMLMPPAKNVEVGLLTTSEMFPVEENPKPALPVVTKRKRTVQAVSQKSSLAAVEVSSSLYGEKLDEKRATFKGEEEVRVTLKSEESSGTVKSSCKSEDGLGTVKPRAKTEDISPTIRFGSRSDEMMAPARLHLSPKESPVTTKGSLRAEESPVMLKGGLKSALKKNGGEVVDPETPQRERRMSVREGMKLVGFDGGETEAVMSPQRRTIVIESPRGEGQAVGSMMKRNPSDRLIVVSNQVSTVKPSAIKRQESLKQVPNKLQEFIAKDDDDDDTELKGDVSLTDQQDTLPSEEIGIAAAKAGLTRRQTQRQNDVEFSNTSLTRSTPLRSPPSKSRQGIASSFACPGFDSPGGGHELMKALAFRRQKTLKLEQTWDSTGQAGGEDIEEEKDSSTHPS